MAHSSTWDYRHYRPDLGWGKGHVGSHQINCYDYTDAWRTPMGPTTLIDDYLSGPALLRQAVASMTQEQLASRPFPASGLRWKSSATLPISRSSYADRIKRIIAENEPTLFSGDPTEFASRLAYHQRSRRGASADCVDPSTGRTDSPHPQARRLSAAGYTFNVGADNTGRPG